MTQRFLLVRFGTSPLLPQAFSLLSTAANSNAELSEK
jgi:hypothetical protein